MREREVERKREREKYRLKKFDFIHRKRKKLTRKIQTEGGNNNIRKWLIYVENVEYLPNKWFRLVRE